MIRIPSSLVALAVAGALASSAPALGQGTYGSYPPPGYPAPQASPPPQGYAPPPQGYAAPQGYAPAPFAQEELDALLAPVALYPDQLLAQLLMAATYPQDVVQAARFVRQNASVRGPSLDEAVAGFDWDPSVQSLTAFPQILDMMNQRMDWTRRLGEAYLSDQNAVMDTVQELRWRAYDAGNLATSPQQNVMVEQRTIYIEPASQQVVYIPTYNPLVIYGPWWVPAYRPYYWRPARAYYPGVALTTGTVAFGLGYHVTANNWGWVRPDWRARHIVVDVHRPNRFVERRPYYREWASRGWWESRREYAGRGDTRGRPYAPTNARPGGPPSQATAPSNPSAPGSQGRFANPGDRPGDRTWDNGRQGGTRAPRDGNVAQVPTGPTLTTPPPSAGTPWQPQPQPPGRGRGERPPQANAVAPAPPPQNPGSVRSDRPPQANLNGPVQPGPPRNERAPQRSGPVVAPAQPVAAPQAAPSGPSAQPPGGAQPGARGGAPEHGQGRGGAEGGKQGDGQRHREGGQGGQGGQGAQGGSQTGAR